MYVSASAVMTNTTGGGTLAWLNNNLVVATDPKDYVGTSKCNGGSISLHLGDADQALSAGTLTITPKCRNCDGSRVNATGLALEVCGHEYDFVVPVPDGPGGSIRTHIYRLFGDHGGWSGADQYGNTATISSAGSKPGDPTFKCCPAHNPNSCDCDCGGACPGCWIADIQTGLSGADGLLELFSSGSCPRRNRLGRDCRFRRCCQLRIR
jgi:hypothetical protein